MLKFIEDIDSGNTHLDYEDLCKILRILSNVGKGLEEELNKTQASDYLGISRATFDNYVRNGLLPKGTKIEGFKELRWYKCDLDLFLNKL